MSANTLQIRLILLGTLTLKPYANNVTRNPVLCYQSIERTYDPHQGHFCESYLASCAVYQPNHFRLFQFVIPKSRYITQSLSMLCVLRTFKLFLESHNRPLYSDISFTLSCGQLDCSDYIVQSCKNNSCIRDEIYAINYSYTYKTSISINIGSALFLFNMPRKNVSLR